jgi:flavin reductase (DIM6/NTAB) family NADH-FMN oxidoreductase RutF
VDGNHRTVDSTEPRYLRNALAQYPTGVTVITTCSPDGRLEGLTVNSFAALSLDPPLVLWSLRRESASLPSFLASGRFAINVLGCEQSHLSKHFAARRSEKFETVAYSRGLGGCPILESPLALFECVTESTREGGDHVIFFGHVDRVSFREGNPLIFSAGLYWTREPMQVETI